MKPVMEEPPQWPLASSPLVGDSDLGTDYSVRGDITVNLRPLCKPLTWLCMDAMGMWWSQSVSGEKRGGLSSKLSSSTMRCLLETHLPCCAWTHSPPNWRQVLISLISHCKVWVKTLALKEIERENVKQRLPTHCSQTAVRRPAFT